MDGDIFITPSIFTLSGAYGGVLSFAIPIELQHDILINMTTMSSFVLASAQLSDLEQLNQLMYELHDEHHQSSPEYFKTAQEIEQEKSIARYLDDPQCLVYVAKRDEKIIGFITGHFCELISTVSKPILMGSLDELYVDPVYRQQGVARELLLHLEKTFILYGVKEIFVEVWAFNQAALQLYQATGFVHHIHWLRKSVPHDQ
ncbi:histone acetyltransferase [Vibrio cincinnatiensis]|jgi:ribosomal protein S18 acetylase RimI-like enzyme|uniref:Ribosomal protein S18 acetylase RimI n=2 Tax=Vibrio cincinnatiensis TaxID=675 RepID=A0A1T4RIN5_VIBCI|nr:Ribosomal protein S18 acetylase RimI [Vibrio cincinnatiensis DSM 19608]SUP48420.1 histone acetyltransferase [Vibrio cincinnatiensis]